MQTITDTLNGIEQKIRQLAEKLEQLQGEKAALSEENQHLRATLAAQAEKVADMEKLLAETTADPEENQEPESKSSQKLKREIAQYIKEIDKCIEWLQNH